MPDGTDIDAIIGQDVEGTRILTVLGQSNLGVVYRAEDLTLGRTVALRRLNPAFVRTEDGVRRVWQWAQGLARMHSPHIVQVYKLCRTDLGAFVVSEYVVGGTLYDQLRSGPMPWRQVFLLAKQMLHALQAAHRSGIVHGDLRPANIMQLGEGSVRVRDFGLSLLYDSIAREGDPMGDLASLYYRPPELLSAGTRPDRRSDLYALGVVIYEMLTGELPYGRPENIYDIIRVTSERPPTPPGASVDDLPEEFVRMVMKALEKDPARRYKTAARMLEALADASPSRTVEGFFSMSMPDQGPVQRRRGLFGLLGRFFPREGDAAPRHGPGAADKAPAVVEGPRRREPVEPVPEPGGGPEAPLPGRCTVFHPTALAPGAGAEVVAYVHTEAADDAVHRDYRAYQAGRGEGEPADGKPAEGEGALTVVPWLPGCRFEPPRARFSWHDDWHRTVFRVQSEPEQPGYAPGQDANGRLSFYAGSVLVAEVGFWVYLEREARVYKRGETHVTGLPYRRIYVSYDPDEAEAAGRVEQARTYLGRGPWTGVQVLRPDEGSAGTLRETIAQADVFQLCWSEAAGGSPEVEAEWRQALAHGGPGFIRAVYWQKPRPELPPELGVVHATFLGDR